MIHTADLGSHPLRVDIIDLQRTSLEWISVFAGCVGFGLLCLGAENPEIGRPVLWVVIVPLAVVIGSAWLLRDRAYILAALVLSGGLITVIAVAAVVYSASEVLFCIPIVMFVFPVLISYRLSAIIGIGSIIGVWLLPHLSNLSLTSDSALFVSFLTITSLALAGISYQPTRVALSWALTTSLQERRKTEEVRERQAELARLAKSLADTCDQLENANFALAHARRAADEARHLKEEFATAISHELRTPLNLILGFSELIVREVDDGDNDVPVGIRRDVETIFRNTSHLSKLVDDVLDLGRLDAHRLALQKELTSLPAIIRDAATSVEELYDRAGLCLSIDLPTDLPLLHVDPTRIRQVLVNLLANAVRYTEDEGVDVSAHRDGGEVIVAVRDTGIGIPTEDLPYVFDYFRQVGEPHRRGGFGVGLTVSKRVIEMHAGSMWVTSQRGEGTTFFFSLPTMANVTAESMEPSLDRLGRHYLQTSESRAILVLDPDVEAARIFERYLDGYLVCVARSLDEARMIVAGEAIQAVVVAGSSAVSDDDLKTLGVDDAMPILRCALRTVARAGRDLGAMAFLIKPVSREQLDTVLRRLKRRPRHAVVFDDDPMMASLLARMLVANSPACQVEIATTGEEGLAVARGLAERGDLDLALLDLLMPGMDGYEVLRRWQAEPDLRSVPVIIVSAASDQDHDLVVGDALEIRRGGGLGVGELMRTVRASLNELLGGEVSPIVDVSTNSGPNQLARPST